MESSFTGATKNSGKRPAAVAGECPERKQQKLYEDIEDDQLIELVIARSLKNDQFLKNLVIKLSYFDKNDVVDEQLLQILMLRMVDDKFLSFVGNKLDPLLNRPFTADSQFWQKQEELMRKVMQEESNIFGYIDFGQSPRKIDQSEHIRYILQFNEDLPERVCAHNKFTIKISISDTQASDCKFSGKVEVFVLEGGFCPDEKGRITREEFDKQIQKPRPGRGPLLVGDRNNKVVVELKDGVGSAVVQFTDNSVGTRTKMFKLGARLHQKEVLVGRVQDGVSRAIRVMDRRSGANEKPEIPLLSDEVYCLKNIGKDGSYHRRLGEKHIRNVQQFLQALAIDQNGLRNLICGGKRGLSREKWGEMVEHAKKCDPGSERRTFTVDGATRLVFDSVFELVGVELNGEYKTASEFPQQALLDNWKKIAFSQKENIQVEHNLIGSSSQLNNVDQMQHSHQTDQKIDYLQGYQICTPVYAPEPNNLAEDDTKFSVDEFLNLENSEWYNLNKNDEPSQPTRARPEAIVRWIKLKVGLKFFATLMTVKVPKTEGANYDL